MDANINFEKVKLTFEGVLVGLIAGTIVSSFRWIIENLLASYRNFYSLVQTQGNLVVLAGIIATLIVFVVINALLLKSEKNIAGSGIPQVELQLAGELKLNWWSILWKKYLGGIISIGPGLFLGREGPSIQLGAMVGQGFGELIDDEFSSHQRILISSGSAAGLAAAFSAPLAGTLFVLEEIYHNFSPLVWITALASAVSANFVTLYIFGLKPILDISHNTSFPIKYYWILLILGIALGVLGRLYQIVLLRMPKWLSYSRIPRNWQGIIPFVLIVPIGLIVPQYLGGGNSIITSLPSLKVGLLALLGLFVFRFIFSMISYGSGLPGGIFLPILNLGAIIGAIFTVIFSHLGLLPMQFESSLIIYAMAGYFACIGKAPFTAIILVTEMVGSLAHLMPLAVVSLVAYLIVDLLGGAPIYESLKSKIKINGSHSTDFNSEDTIEVPVYEGSQINGKEVRQLSLPNECLIVKIYRGEKLIIPHGDIMILSGDRIIFSVPSPRRAEYRSQIRTMINGIN